MKKYAFFCGFLILAAVCTAEHRNDFAKPDQTVVIDVGKQVMDYDFNEVNFVAVNDYNVVEDLAMPCEMLLVPNVSYNKRKFVSHNRRINAFNKQMYGESSKQKQEHLLIEDPLSSYTGEDIERPAWQLNWASLVKLDI